MKSFWIVQNIKGRFVIMTKDERGTRFYGKRQFLIRTEALLHVEELNFLYGINDLKD